MAEKKKKSKWKRRIKKALKLAALGTLAYGASKMFGGRKKKFGTDAGFLKSGAAGGASLSSPPILGTDHIKKTVIPELKPKKKSLYTDRGITVGTGVKESATGNKIPAIYPGSDEPTRGVRAQSLQAQANAPKGIYPPGMVRVPRTGVHPRGRLTEFKQGGRVTGIAKRGFGRALMKGKK